jgi:hypothetical protein
MKIQAWWKACTAPAPVETPRMATRPATPRAMPICRLMTNSADPVAKRSGGNGAVAAPPSEGSMSPTPMPLRMLPGR